MAVSAKVYTNTGTTVMHTGPILFHGLVYKNTTANAATITIYDNTAASGTVIYQETAGATVDTVGSSNTRMFNNPVQALTGVTVAVTGTTPNVLGALWME
jgi:hypothetical protein